MEHLGRGRGTAPARRVDLADHLARILRGDERNTGLFVDGADNHVRLRQRQSGGVDELVIGVEPVCLPDVPRYGIAEVVVLGAGAEPERIHSLAGRLDRQFGVVRARHLHESARRVAHSGVGVGGDAVLAVVVHLQDVVAVAPGCELLHEPLQRCSGGAGGGVDHQLPPFIGSAWEPRSRPLASQRPWQRRRVGTAKRGQRPPRRRSCGASSRSLCRG